MKYKFERVEIVATCRSVDGKRKQKTFWQTLNPWNCINGCPKTRREILKELLSQAEQWKTEMSRENEVNR